MIVADDVLPFGPGELKGLAFFGSISRPSVRVGTETSTRWGYRRKPWPPPVESSRFSTYLMK
jgi:hypothetical protein